jgi:trigger factor
MAADLTGNFQFTIQEVTEFEKAKVDQELFNKVYGEGTVGSEKEFREKIADELANMYKNDSDYKFNIDAIDHFVKKHKLELPVEFLKRWIIKSNKEKVSNEELERDFPKFEKDMKWQLIKNKIVKANEIEVKEEDALELAKQMVLNQYRQYGLSNIPDDILANSAGQILQNEQERRRVYENVADQKVFQYLKENVKLDEKEISLEKFGKFFEESNK